MKDLKEERSVLAEAINRNRSWVAVYAESFIARSESPRKVCLEEVRNSHIYIGLFKSRYGYIPKHNNPRGLSVVAMEYNEAKNNQIPRLIFIYKDAIDREYKLKEFLKEITDFDEGHWRKEYSAIDELVQFVLDALNHEVTKRSVESIEADRKSRVQDIYSLSYFRGIAEAFVK